MNAKARKLARLAPEAGVQTVACSGAAHRIEVTARGRVRYLDHTAADIAVLKTAHALAGLEHDGCAGFVANVRANGLPRWRTRDRQKQQPITLDPGTVRSRAATRAWQHMRVAALVGRHESPMADARHVVETLSEHGTTVLEYLRAVHTLGARVYVADSRNYAAVLRLDALPQGRRAGRVYVRLPGRGRAEYDAPATLARDADGDWCVRRIPGTAPKPKTTAASRAEDHAARLASYQRMIAAECDTPECGISRADHVLVGDGFSGRQRARFVSPAHVAQRLAERPVGAWCWDSGGGVANAYKYPAEMEVAVGVRVEKGVVVFIGVADAHGSDCAAKAVTNAVGALYRQAGLEQSNVDLKQAAARGLLQYAEACFRATVGAIKKGEEES